MPPKVSLTAKGEGAPRVRDRTSTILDKQEAWVAAKLTRSKEGKKVHTLGSGETHAPCASHVFSNPLAVQTAVSLSPNKEARVQMCGHLLCQLPNSIWAFINPAYLKTCVTLEALRVGTQSEVFSPKVVSNRNLISPSPSYTRETVVYINLQRLNPFFPKSLWLAWVPLANRVLLLAGSCPHPAHIVSSAWIKSCWPQCNVYWGSCLCILGSEGWVGVEHLCTSARANSQ